MIRTRIAPSPTGSFHIGNARTALFNYLFAKKQGGQFIVRIEDTDRERSEKKFEDDILDSLEWLGIRADEGPREGGPYAPYRQSERAQTYSPPLKKLLSAGHAFYCFHSEAELESEKKALAAAGKNPAHACEFRETFWEEQQKMLAENSSAVIRFKTPRDQTIAFEDMIRGRIEFASHLLGDFSIAKNPVTPLYNFAVVIDDAAMEITHVIRGEDHISNTPKQMLIQEALGLPTPKYAHLPIILGPDRSKLSKRHGATAISEFKSLGYLPEALINFMALLGWNPGDERAALEKGESRLSGGPPFHQKGESRPKGREIFSMAELIKEFDLAKVQKSGAVFNIEKLDWMNGEYIRKKSPSELAELAKPYLEIAAGKDAWPEKSYLEKIVALEQPRLKKLSEVGEGADYFFREPKYDKELLRWKDMSDAEVRASLKKSEKIIFNFQFSIFKEKSEEAFLKEIGAGDKGRILWPLRVALTGKKASAGPFEIIEILGKEKTLTRVQQALQKIS